MRYTTDDMRNWAGNEPDLGIGGVETAMREAADEIDRLQEKAKVMRDAIDKMELALMGFGTLPELVRLWGEPHHRPELKVILRTNCGEVHRVNDALAELNRIVNSPDFQL